MEITVKLEATNQANHKTATPNFIPYLSRVGVQYLRISSIVQPSITTSMQVIP